MRMHRNCYDLSDQDPRQNRLIYLAADQDSVSCLKNQVRTWPTCLSNGSGRTKSRKSALWRSGRRAAAYLYLPRLRDEAVFIRTLGAGVEGRDFFGMEGDRYLGFSFGKPTSIFLDASHLLIEPATAAASAEALRAKEEAERATREGANVIHTPTGSTGEIVAITGADTSGGSTPVQVAKTQESPADPVLRHGEPGFAQGR